MARMLFSICMYAIYLPFTTALNDQVVFSNPPNVAIIGAGAAGASTAYHIHKFAQDSGISLNLTIFERNPYIGGRSTTVNTYDDPSQPVELGASIFVEVNKILVEAVREFDLSTSEFSQTSQDIPGAAYGIWNGEQFVIEMASESGWWDYAKLFWRYGTAPVYTNKLMKKTVGNFLKLYGSIFPFESLTQAAQDAELLAVTASTGEQYISEHGIGMKFAYEVVQASTRVNYAQNLAFIHGLEAMVCMATDGAMSVQGGNWQIFHNMVASTNGHVLPRTSVVAVEKLSSGRWAVNAWTNASTKEELEVETADFDEIVLAAPYQFANISINGLGSFAPPDKIPYVKLHVTLLTSSHLPSARFFGLSDGQAVPHVILTTLSEAEKPQTGPTGVGAAGFFSLSLLRPVINPKTGRREYLYKIFSAAPPNSDLLARLFGFESTQGELDVEGGIGAHDISWIYRKIWDSYPYGYPRVTFEEIKLAPGLWYSGGMDSFISTMETNALMGKNIARLIVDGWANGAMQSTSG
ncbi:Prenylcysteine oxidase [Polychaeton citri CBS 116435]|uniref:Prenylcysteine oxidase n=1 Tax=Polychaeton citri CBS 116435 TaxID=1314669 RepID=A0A9P4Q1Q8_9PEZI|nr:Prenylcysteine oxidase [Polychaeton citri CBS 116435]